MADGSTKPIDEVEVGDWVLAADPATGEQGARQVTDVIVGSGTKQLVQLTIEGDTVTATDRHPFWVTDDAAWVDAEDLEPGDRLLLADGSTVPVEAVREYTVEAIVHNLAVEDLHTYFVLARDDAVLVHNCTSNQLNEALPRQVHHYATNKSSTYTPRMNAIARAYGLDLDGAWNTELLPGHLGRHPNAYHEFVLNGMERASREAGASRARFVELFEHYVRSPVRQHPELLRRSGWEQ